MRLNLSEIEQCLNLEQHASDAVLTGVAIDSRKVAPGDLFVCIQGDCVDGHDFASAAVDAGAAAVLAKKPLPGISVPLLQVDDTVNALGSIAGYWRNKSTAKVVCLTGTAGKTTLKDTLASILSKAGSVSATKGNLNNQIGLPLSILAAEGNEDFWVLEAGISHAGDMEYLSNIVRPDLAIILNVGAGHTEGLGNKGVAWHKTRLLMALASDGQALINSDYPDLLAETRRLAIKYKTFSCKSQQSDFGLISANGDCYELDLEGKMEAFKTPFTAAFGAENVLAAAAAATMLSVTPEKIRAGFADAILPDGRFRHLSAGGFEIIDDTYNANPLSMTRALRAAAQEAARLSLPLIVVLGEMRELGTEAGAHHFSLGRELGALAPVAVFWKGGMQAEVKAGLKQFPMGTDNSPIVLGEPAAFMEQWRQEKLPDRALVLFKGSRANKLEEYLSELVKFVGEQDVL